MTVNQVAKHDSYPLPRINDLLARLGGTKVFSKLDMSQAYQQLALDSSQHPLSLLISQKVLIYYEARKPLILACDASPVGIGAVLSHQEDDGSERPIAFASRTLTTAEQKYAR